MATAASAQLPLTGARRRALAVMAGRNPHIAREANQTSAQFGEVHWQVARWLVDAGLAQRLSGRGDQLRLTGPGLVVCEREGLGRG